MATVLRARLTAVPSRPPNHPERFGKELTGRLAFHLDRLIAAELAGRPYELVAVAGGWQHRTRPAFAGVIQASGALGTPGPALGQDELTILMAIAYFQPLTRTDLSTVLGRNVSRDAIAALRKQDYVASGPRGRAPRSRVSPAQWRARATYWT